MRRLSLFLVAFVAVTGAILLLILLFAFGSTPGRRIIADILERELSETFSADVQIAKLAGAPPHHLRIHGLVISRDGERFIEFNEIELIWRPDKLLHGAIVIDQLSLNGAAVRLAERTEHSARERLMFPEQLPAFSIDRLAFNNIQFVEGVPNAPLRIDGESALSMDGKAFKARLAARSTSNRDLISVTIERNADGGVPILDINVFSRADGALSTLVRSNGPILIRAAGAGPSAAYRTDFVIHLGGYGFLKGIAASDLTPPTKLTVAAKGGFGARLDVLRKELGETFDFQGALTLDNDAAILSIQSLRTRIGEASGAVTRIQAPARNALPRTEFGLSVQFAESWRPAIQRYAGDRVRLTGSAVRAGDAFEGDLLAMAPRGQIRATRFLSDLRHYWRGPVELIATENSSAPIGIRAGLSAKAFINIERGQPLRLNGLSAETKDEARISGDMTYSSASRALDFQGDLALKPRFIKAIWPRIKSAGPMSARISFSGERDNYAIRLAGVTPAMSIGGKGVGPASHAIALNGSRKDFGGAIASRSLTGAGSLRSRIARKASGEWRIFDFLFEGDGFAFTGGGALNSSARTASIDLHYRGDDNAEPFPGVISAGEAFAVGKIDPASKSNMIELSIPALSTGGVIIEGLRAAAYGPLESLRADVEMSAAKFPGSIRIDDLDAALAFDVEKIGVITLSSLRAWLNDSPIRLDKPAIVTIGEAVKAMPLVFMFDRGGSIRLDGERSKTRWRANAVVRQAPLFGGMALADADIALDTSNPTPAIGALSIASTFSDSNAPEVALKFAWDGHAVKIEDSGDDPRFHFNISMPLKLRRHPSLAIGMPGHVNGRVAYHGRIETVSIFLPAFARSLEGNMQLEGEISGTLKNPAVSGDLIVSNGAMTDLSSGVSIVNIDGEAKARVDAAQSRVDFVVEGSGPRQSFKSIIARGAIAFADRPFLNSTIVLDRAELSAGPVEYLKASGEVDLSGPVTQLTARGAVDVARLDAVLIEPQRTGLVDIDVQLHGANETRVGSPHLGRPPPIKYSLHVAGEKQIYIKGRGLDSEWRAIARIDGVAGRPLVLGRLALIDGHIQLGGRRINLTSGLIEFDRLTPNDPSLDIRAERRTSTGAEVSIVVRGRASAPDVTIAAAPSMPQEDAMALLLFDKPLSELTALQSLQVADSLSELGGVGLIDGKGVSATMRSALGLDLLDVKINEADSAASVLTIGKYVTDGLFVSASQDARGEAGSVTIEYEINNSFSIGTELRQDGDQKISVNWKKDF